MPELTGPRPDGFPCWVDLGTSDVDAAVLFLQDVLGWEFETTGPAYGGYRMARAGGKQVAGVGPTQGNAPSAWTVYLAARDTAALTDKAQSLGAQTLVAPMEVPGQGLMSIVMDPTGAAFGLWQPLGHHGFELIEEDGAFTWAEVNTPQAGAAKEFYGELFGLEASDEAGAGTTYYTLSRGDQRAAGILQMTAQWEGVPPHWMVYFRVPDVDAATAAVTAGGGRVHNGPFDTPYGRIAVVGDPTGANFSLLQRPTSE